MYIVGIEDNYYTTNEFTSPAVFTCRRMLSPPIFKRCIRFEPPKPFH